MEAIYIVFFFFITIIYIYIYIYNTVLVSSLEIPRIVSCVDMYIFSTLTYNFYALDHLVRSHTCALFLCSFFFFFFFFFSFLSFLSTKPWRNGNVAVVFERRRWGGEGRSRRLPLVFFFISCLGKLLAFLSQQQQKKMAMREICRATATTSTSTIVIVARIQINIWEE